MSYLQHIEESIKSLEKEWNYLNSLPETKEIYNRKVSVSYAIYLLEGKK